jgi:lysophospholipase L1-like esterase
MTPTGNQIPVSLIRALRAALTGIAILLVLLAALDPDRRWFFLAVGGLAAGSAALAYRIVESYGSMAIVAFNALLLLFTVEVAATGGLSLAHLPATKTWIADLTGRPIDLIDHHYLRMPYYRDAPWGEAYWREFQLASRKTYHPYVVWRSPPFSGETLNVDGKGQRVTPGAECEDGAVEVFVFGGSAIWGWGAPDWGTIPAYLQRELAAGSEEAVCVTNFGENAFVANQSLIQLIMELERGHIPDVVLYYDGVNEVFAAHQNGGPILHQNLAEIRETFQPRQPLRDALEGLSTVQFLERFLAWVAPPGAGDPPSTADPATVPEEVAAAYLEAHRIVEGLATRHGFDFAFIWQPHILAGDKVLTPEEEAIVTGLNWVVNLDDGLRALFAETYRTVGERAAEEPRLVDLSGVFDATTSTVWIDTWGHVTPEGNEIVARAIAGVLSAPWPGLEEEIRP